MRFIVEEEDHESAQEGARFMCNYEIVEALTKIREEVLSEHGESGLDVVNQKIKEARDALYK